LQTIQSDEKGRSESGLFHWETALHVISRGPDAPAGKAQSAAVTKYCPAYPRPITNRWTAWWRALFGRDSLLEQLTVTSYRMQMGEARLPGHEFHTVNDPEAVRKVLVEQHANFPKHRFMDDLLRPLLGRSIFTSNGEDWAQQRRLMEPAFEQTRMDHAFPLMRDAAVALLERLRRYPAGATCDVEAEFTHFTADVIFRTIFSQPLAADDADRIFRAFAAFQRAAPKATMPRYRSRWWQWLAGGRPERETVEAASEIRELLRRQVGPRHAAFHAGQTGGQVDILASLLAAREPGTGRSLDPEELVNQIAVLYLAGHETSASALAWTLHFLAHDDAIQQRVRAEIDGVLGGATTVELEQLRDLDLTRRVFRETLRLYPPLSFLVREAVADTCLRDKTVHAGATVVVSPWLIHRHRLYWERPDEFDPDRFLTEAGRASARNAFLPFSIGPRVCVGAGFALQEAALVLTLVLREFAFAPLPGHDPMPVARLSLRSDRGVKLKLQPR